MPTVTDPNPGIQSFRDPKTAPAASARLCGAQATDGQDLTAGAGSSLRRRYLATPVSETMANTLPHLRFRRHRRTEEVRGSKGRWTQRRALKARLPSRHVTEGPARAPHRSYYYAMGLTTAQIHQPFVGVASCWNEAAPCNISLMRQAQAVKKGVAAAGGTPREFCTITVTDGIAMGHDGMKSSLPSREVIADSVELTMRGHGYDALVGLAGCDKSLPGMMMAMCRLNVPSIFIYGGSILPGTFKGQPVTVQDVFEAVGKHSVGADVGRRSFHARAECLPVGWRLRRPVHRQHHGHRVRGHRLGLAVFGRRARALRDPRCLLHDRGRADDGSDQGRPAAAPYRDAQGVGECGRGGVGLRRLDQCGAASAGHRPRMRVEVRSVRRGGSLQKNTIHRRFETRRPLCRQRPVRSWRRSTADEDAARTRLPARRLHDRDGPHDRGKSQAGEVEQGAGRGASGRQAAARDRRRRRAEG